MSEIPANPTQSVKRRNPHLYAPLELGPVRAPDRVRQSSKPLLNQLELEWYRIILVKYPNYPRPRPQAVTFRLANGVRYSPDLFTPSWPGENPTTPFKPTAWEVKGKRAWDDAIVKIKVAAHEWPDIQWILVWKERGQWQEQRILP